MELAEAIKNREECLEYLEGIGQKASLDCVEAVRWSVKALKALRPVSREQVEKVWRGEWELHGGGKNGRGGIWHCTRCEKSYPYKNDFCPMCGAPMTDEAVDMVMERLEALKDGPEQ